MPRIRNAVIAATVLAVGASLAFREGAFYQRAAGVEPLSSKSAARSALAEEERKRERPDGAAESREELLTGFDLAWFHEAEAFLKAKGRSTGNLVAAYLIADHAPYLEEISLRKTDPVAVSFLCLKLHKEEAWKQWRALEPGNVFVAVEHVNDVTNRGCGFGEQDYAPAIQELLAAAKGTSYFRHDDEWKNALLEFSLCMDNDVRGGWTRIASESAGEHDRLFLGRLGEALTERMTGGDTTAEEKRGTAVAIRDLAQLAEAGGEGYAAAQWQKFLCANIPADAFRTYLGVEKSVFEEAALAREKRYGWQSPLFREAIASATEEDLATMEVVRQEKGVAAAQQDFWRRVNVAELEEREARKIEQRRAAAEEP